MFVVAHMEMALLDECTDWAEVVSNLCELLLSKFKILHWAALISDKVVYVGRIIISLLAFESFMSRVFLWVFFGFFLFFNGKNNLPSGLVIIGV